MPQRHGPGYRIPFSKLPEISEDRVRELSRRALDAPEPDGLRQVERRELGPEVGPGTAAWFAGLQRLKGAKQPAILFLWNGPRVVFVGRSAYGLVGLDQRNHGLGVDFDDVSFMPVPEEVLDSVVVAFVRQLRPRFNRCHFGELTDFDRDLLGVYGFPVERAA